jgi:uncharacterized protein (TIGR02099 family)
VLNWLIGIFATLIILLALALGTLRVVLQQVPEYREQIRARLNAATQLDFRFQGLDARWRVFGPEIYVTDAQVFVPNGGPLLAEARAASIGVDLWRVLFRAEMLPGRIRLIEPEIALVRTEAGRLELEGQAALDPRDSNRFNVDDLPTGLLEIEGARVTFVDQRLEMRPLSLRGVDLSIERDRNEIALEGEVDLPEKMGGSLELIGAARGNLEDPQAVAWSLELSGRDLQLAGWRDFLGRAATLPASGSGQLRLSAGLQGSQLVSAGLHMKFKDLTISPGEGARVTRYPVVAGDLSLLKIPTGWRLQGRGLEFSTASHHWAPTSLTASWQYQDGRLQSVDADVEYLRAESLVPLVALLPPGTWRDRVLQLRPEGVARDVRGHFSPRESDFPSCQVRARLQDAGFQPIGRAPGLEGLTGTVEGDDTKVSFSIDSRDLQFTLPYMFRETLSADARGVMTATRSGKAWTVATRGFAVRNAHAKAVTDGELLLPGDGTSPVLRLDSKFRDAVLVEGWRYLPINRLTGHTLAWLDAAFLSGRAPQGEFFFQGATRSFPFRDGSGEFRIRFPVEGLTLHYGEGWPRIENISADIEFHNAGLTGTVTRGEANGLSITAGRARFADFKTAELELEARAGGDLAAALGYLQQSPIGPAIGPAFMKLRGQGKSSFDVDALLPITHLDDRKVQVDARVAPGGRLALDGTAHVLEQLEGSLSVRDRLVTSEKGLTATYLGGPVKIELAAESAGDRYEDIVRVHGETAAQPLLQALAVPATIKLDGTVDWRGVARIPVANPGEERAPQRMSVRLDSTLEGAAVNLPQPFAKAAADTRPLRVDLQWPSDQVTLVRASYGPDIRTQVALQLENGKWTFERGVLRFGEGDLRMPGAGLELRGSLDTLDLSEWLKLGSGSPAPPEAGPARRRVSDYLRSADLSVRDFALFGFRFPQVNASLLAGESAWSVSVDGPRARGTLLVPYDFSGSEPLTLNLARLSLGEAGDAVTPAPPEAAEEDPDPREWPSVRASIGQFEAWGKKLGFLRAELVRTATGLRLDSFSTRASSFEANGSGSWTVSAGAARGALKFRLESTNVLETLQDLGYGASLSGEKGLLDADLTWVGAPSATLAGRLSGTVRLEADDGKLLNVEPGAGRVFGLMSVAALPRRLTFDFRDFLTKGLSYDTIRGDFRLDDGNAFTENLLLKGPAAEIGIVGRTGLEARDYDQTAVVTGSIGNSLPVAGALAGGPAVGAALLLFSQIFKEPLKGIARGYYRITGPWENPTVQRVDREEGKDAVRTAEGAGAATN